MSNNPKKRMDRKTKTFITGAVFVLAILVVILCIMSGSMKFKSAKTDKTEPTPTPAVTAPAVVPTPTPTPTPTTTPNELKVYTVTVFAGHGGAANPSGSSTVKEGGTVTVYFTPESGYKVGTVTVNGELVDASESYTISDISTDMSIDVSFEPIDNTQPTDTPIEPPAGQF